MSLLRITNFELFTEAAVAFRPQQLVRWRNKPRWLPVAKTKLFRVPVKPVRDPVEYEELKRLHNNYRTQVSALRKFCWQSLDEEIRLLKSISSVEEEERQWAEVVKVNELWNKEIAQEREIYLKNKLEDRLEKIKIYKGYEKKKKDFMQSIAKSRMEKFIELKKTFITRETLDDAILHCLDNPVNYNFAIELDGNKIIDSDNSSDKEKQTIKQ